MNIGVIVKLFTSLLPLIKDLALYLTGKKQGKEEVEREILEKENKRLKEQNEKLKDVEKLDEKDYTNDRDDLYSRL